MITANPIILRLSRVPSPIHKLGSMDLLMMVCLKQITTKLDMGVDIVSDLGWLDMTKHYATAFKTGSYPDVTEDKLYLWARPHPKDADAPDGVGKPTNFAVVSFLHFPTQSRWGLI